MIEIKQVLINPDKTINMNIQDGERVIRLHSSRPLAEADKIFSQLQSDAPVYFIGGLACGYLLEKILQETTVPCVVFEPLSPIFKKVLELRPEIKKSLEDSRVYLAHNIPSLHEIIKVHKFKNISFTIHRPYGELFPKEMDASREAISSELRKQEVGNNTLLRFGKIWTKNIIRNLHRYFKNNKLNAYLGWGENKPALIIGAGASLEEALPYIKEHQDKAIIIACDTVVPMLERASIDPDFVITVDAQEKNAFFLRYGKRKNHKLIADPSVHDSSFEGYEDDNIILMDSIFPFYTPFEGFWESNGLLASGGSVSTSAFDLARKMQCDPIILVGMDLAFTKKKTHSTGNILYEFARTNHHRLSPLHSLQSQTTHANHSLEVKGRRANKKISSDIRLVLFRDWFSDQIPKTNAHVIVAGLEGAYLEGAEHCEMSDTFSKLTSPIEKAHPNKSPLLSSSAYQKFLEDTLLITDKIIPACNSSLLLIKKAKATNNLPLAIQESTKIQHLLEAPENKQIPQLISTAIQDSVQLAFNMNSSTTEKEHLDILHQIASDILKGLIYLQKYLKKALKFIK